MIISKPWDGLGKPWDGLGKPWDGLGEPWDGLGNIERRKKEDNFEPERRMFNKPGPN